MEKAIDDLELEISQSEINGIQRKLDRMDLPELEREELKTKLRLLEEAKDRLSAALGRRQKQQYRHLKTLEVPLTLFMFATLLSSISLVVLDLEHIYLSSFGLSRFLYIVSLGLLFLRIYSRFIL